MKKLNNDILLIALWMAKGYNVSLAGKSDASVEDLNKLKEQTEIVKLLEEEKGKLRIIDSS